MYNGSNKTLIKNLLIVTALFESVTGIGLIAMPALLVRLLLGVTLDTSGALVLAHVAGAALLTLGIACWLARNDTKVRAIISAMLVYNFAVAGVLMHANLGLGVYGIGLWPAAGAHFVMAFWCIACLRAVRDKLLNDANTQTN